MDPGESKMGTDWAVQVAMIEKVGSGIGADFVEGFFFIHAITIC